MTAAGLSPTDKKLWVEHRLGLDSTNYSPTGVGVDEKAALYDLLQIGIADAAGLGALLDATTLVKSVEDQQSSFLLSTEDGKAQITLKGSEGEGSASIDLAVRDGVVPVEFNVQMDGFRFGDMGVAGAYRMFQFGTVSPAADTGVAAPVGSLFSRDNAGTGELWLKTGAADTAWSKLALAVA